MDVFVYTHIYTHTLRVLYKMEPSRLCETTIRQAVVIFVFDGLVHQSQFTINSQLGWSHLFINTYINGFHLSRAHQFTDSNTAVCELSESRFLLPQFICIQATNNKVSVSIEINFIKLH